MKAPKNGAGLTFALLPLPINPKKAAWGVTGVTWGGKDFGKLEVDRQNVTGLVTWDEWSLPLNQHSFHGDIYKLQYHLFFLYTLHFDLVVVDKLKQSCIFVSKLCRYESELYMQTQWKRGTKFSIGTSILGIPVE